MGWWFQKLGFEYVDYTDQIFQSLIKTKYAKKQFSLFLSVVLTWIVRWHLQVFFVNFIHIHPFVDYFLQIAVSVCLVFKTSWIKNIVLRFQKEIYALSRYLINNYTPENFRIWRRNITVASCIYLIVYLYFIEINSIELIKYISQFLISYFVVDGIETGLFKSYWLSIINYLHTKTRKQGIKHKNNEIIIRDQYIDERRQEDNTLMKSWMLMDDVEIIEDSPTHSVVIFNNKTSLNI